MSRSPMASILSDVCGGESALTLAQVPGAGTPRAPAEQAEVARRVDDLHRVPVPLRAGSAVFFGPMIIHGSDANHSDPERRACTIAYNVTGNGAGRVREVLRGTKRP
jgi:ectoine hydroxylase-related dioxygenase (phytanoyl-CoA dioxygenase family)